MTWVSWISDSFANHVLNAPKYNVILVDIGYHQEKLITARNLVEKYDKSILDEKYALASGESIYDALRHNPYVGMLKKRFDEGWPRRIADNLEKDYNYYKRILVIPNSQVEINSRITMPDGTDGLLCIKCGEYYPYVEPNSPEGYICFNH